MKNKPIRHKEENVFKFQSFGDRIANIDVDIFHKVSHPNEADSEKLETYFYQTIEKWNVLNLTESYNSFRKKVTGIITLPQLLYKKDYVVEVLLSHIKLKNPLSLQPLLEIVVALAKDLRKEFYPYYEQVLNILIELLNIKNEESLEWTFTCLAYLCKFLWKYFVTNINSVFKSLLPLLSDNKPEYINNFAAESFSFVGRKVKDKHSFLILLLETLETNKDGVPGCGKLLFEVIKGVNGLFHSCAENNLKFYFEFLCNETEQQNVCFEVLQQVVINMVQKIQPKQGYIFWKSIIPILDKHFSKYNCKNLGYLLKIIILVLDQKHGRFLNSYSEADLLLIKEYLKVVNYDNLDENILLLLSKIGSQLVNSNNIQISQEYATSIVRKTLNLENKTVKLDFIDKLIDYSGFEITILPIFLKYFSQTLDYEVLKLLTKIIVNKSPLAQNGINLSNWRKYPLDFGNETEKVLDYLLNFIVIEDSDINNNSLMFSLIILPHINLPITKEKYILDKLSKNIETLHHQIKNYTSKENLQFKLYLLSNIVECIVHISNSANVLNENIFHLQNYLICTILKFAPNFPFTICCLRIIDLIVTAGRNTEFISLENLKEIDQTLLPLLSSPFHQVRLLTTHIYTMFEKVSELNQKSESWKIFSLCYKTELTELSVQTYRNQIGNLSKLSFEKPQGCLTRDSNFETFPLRYFLGVLYINFRLLWDPTINLIHSYANGMNLNLFWNVFLQQLHTANDHVKNGFNSNFNQLNSDVEFLNELHSNLFKVDDKPDFINYRILLWKSMVSFSDVAEMKNKDLITLLFSFYEEEYNKSNNYENSTLNIKQHDSSIEDDPNETVTEDNQNQVMTPNGKSNFKMLITVLTLFSKMRNPKMMYRESELYAIYKNLLRHKNADIQKVVLECIMAYKYEQLTPYRENLFRLIDEKQCKKELALFRIDSETALVQSEHRKFVIPIVLRIVYNKMMAKAGNQKGGRSTEHVRKNQVLRFLAGCHEEEMLKFVHMSFKSFESYFDEDLELMIDNIITKIDLEKFVPPKILQSTLVLLGNILEQFGGLMGNQILSYLLKILLVIGAFLVGAFEQKDSIHSGFLTILKNIRSSCQLILNQFFAQFDNYPWTKKEINAVFDVFIWPYLAKLPMEGIHSPTPLLKLFQTWAQNPKYFTLFVKSKNTNEFALSATIKLCLMPQINISVTNVILEILENLLLLKTDENETQIEVDGVNLIPSISEELNYGSCILFPFVTDILEKFQRKLLNKTKTFNQKELFIISRISELVQDPKTSDTVLSLIIPMAVRKVTSGGSDETIFQFIQTIFNLMKSVENPQIHLKEIAPLFGEVTAVESRKLLCQVVALIGKIERLQASVEVVQEINAFSKKWLDQPNFDRRHKAFKRISDLIKTNDINLDLGVIIVYNCFYVIRNENDLALREGSRMCLKEILPHLIKQLPTVDKDYLLNEVVFDLLRKGIKNKNEHYRYESISLLGLLARECPDSHLILKDLSHFGNKVDLEVDFFENLLHLQLYRQTKALNKFNQICKNLMVPLNTKTCINFILPLVSSYLLNEKFAQKNSLIDSTIEAVKTVCLMLPWHQYESILKFYLGHLRRKLNFQKQLVKLTVAILDAYHFDLSKADKTTQIEIEEQPSVKDNKKTQNEEPVEEEKDIDEILEETSEEIPTEEEDTTKIVNIPAVQRQTVLCPSAARRVIFNIRTVLLPQLNKTLAEMTQYEGSHKLNRKKTGIDREEEELQKVPISLAVVKLLQKLPDYILERTLPGVFMKTCTFLKSHLDSVRRVTREILQKIMATLGPKYLNLLLNEMVSLLTRGFQVHVLVYTIHSIIVSLKNLFQPTDIDKCLLLVLDICKIDLFGYLAEEKEVNKITRKVSEAKSGKSFDTFQILAQFITEKCLMDIIFPLKEILTESHSFKTVNKVQECLRRIVLGLVDNTYISVESLLTFAYGTSSESIPQFVIKNDKPQLTEKEKKLKTIEKPDCFIIPKPPVYKSGYRINHVKNSMKTNAHLLIEFGLRLCYFILKRDKIKVSDYAKYIDPFIGVLKNCLSSHHVKMCTLTLQCLNCILKYSIPSLEENIQEITTIVFELLHKYAAAGLSKGDNFDLVVIAFKFVAILVRDVKYYNVTTEQLKALLLYAEQDINDYDRQATAFALLKAIIGRKLIIPEIHDVMTKVAELSITSEHAHVRLQCRQVFHQFLMDYPLGKKLSKHLEFFLNQLNYEMQSGRESVLELIFACITSFPKNILKLQSGMFFVMLGISLVNDESPECRKMAAKCIETMLEKLDKPDRDNLFEITLKWFEDKKINHRRLAAQLCGIFITTEKSNFINRLTILTPIIKQQLSPHLDENIPGKYVRIKQSVEQNDEDESKIQPRDHQLFQLLQMLLKICTHCPNFLDQTEDIEAISQFVQTLLGYPHEWVRISAVKFIGFVLSKLQVDHLSNLLLEKKSDEVGYLCTDPESSIRSLTLDLCAQLQPENVKSEMAEQIIKNLLFIVRVLHKIPIDKSHKDKTPINLFWLTKQMRKIINREIVEASNSTIIRTEVFKWVAGVATIIEPEILSKILNSLLPPLVRELSTVGVDAQLRQLAKEVTGLIRNKVGHQTYISTLSKIQTELNVRRAERKRQRVQLVVTNPEIAAQKRIKLQQKKKQAKKRKMDGIKGKKPMKKRRRTEIECDEF